MSRATRWLDARAARGPRLRVDASPSCQSAEVRLGSGRIIVEPSDATLIIEALQRWAAAGYRPPAPARLPDAQHAAVEVLVAQRAAAELAVADLDGSVEARDAAREQLAALPIADRSGAVGPAEVAALRAKGLAAVRRRPGSDELDVVATLAARHYLELVER